MKKSIEIKEGEVVEFKQGEGVRESKAVLGKVRGHSVLDGEKTYAIDVQGELVTGITHEQIIEKYTKYSPRTKKDKPTIQDKLKENEIPSMPAE